MPAMSSPSTPSPLPAGLVLGARIVLLIAVCGGLMGLVYFRPPDDTRIVEYSAPKDPVRRPREQPTTSGEPARLWGAIVPHAADLWFFKLTGPIADVAGLDAKLREFLASVKFDGDQPKWNAPDGWLQRPGNEFRFATLVIPSEPKPLELTVSKLSRGDGPLEDQLLANVNRWRGQVALPPLEADGLAKESERLSVAGEDALIVSYDGVAQPNAMGRPPFAGRRE